MGTNFKREWFVFLSPVLRLGLGVFSSSSIFAVIDWFRTTKQPTRMMRLYRRRDYKRKRQRTASTFVPASYRPLFPGWYTILHRPPEEYNDSSNSQSDSESEFDNPAFINDDLNTNTAAIETGDANFDSDMIDKEEEMEEEEDYNCDYNCEDNDKTEAKDHLFFYFIVLLFYFMLLYFSSVGSCSTSTTTIYLFCCKTDPALVVLYWACERRFTFIYLQ